MHLLTWTVVDENQGNLKLRLELNVRGKDYATLSHRWGNYGDEVTYNDMVSGQPEKKAGYKKLLGCCIQAWDRGLQYVWIDTCCINKDSSAELSEAITSMYSYYERSKVCFVYLDDVAIDSTDDKSYSFSLSRSLWFTRGWTLQELIAPGRVKFFDQSWTFIGYKTDAALSRAIETITNIDAVVLNSPSVVKQVSVAKRMSWAARRKTTRIEDRAYSLMGIFGVFIPPMYGEGAHAFIRLQAAILSASNDHSLFT